MKGYSLIQFNFFFSKKRNPNVNTGMKEEKTIKYY